MMMPIVDTAVRKRISCGCLSVVIFIFGLISYYSMPRESTPDITIPYIYVMTTYPGVAPVDIEKSITIPIENKLRGLKGGKGDQLQQHRGDEFHCHRVCGRDGYR